MKSQPERAVDWAIVSLSQCLHCHRGGNKWLGCHLQKQFNNSFVYGAGQKGLLWRVGAQMVIRLKEAHTHTHIHAPTHTQSQERPVLETGSSPTCTPYATVADILLSRPMLRAASYTHYHTHSNTLTETDTQMHVHVQILLLFYNCSVFPQRRSFLAYWCVIVLYGLQREEFTSWRKCLVEHPHLHTEPHESARSPSQPQESGMVCNYTQDPGMCTLRQRMLKRLWRRT